MEETRKYKFIKIIKLRFYYKGCYTVGKFAKEEEIWVHSAKLPRSEDMVQTPAAALGGAKGFRPPAGQIYPIRHGISMLTKEIHTKNER